MQKSHKKTQVEAQKDWYEKMKSDPQRLNAFRQKQADYKRSKYALLQQNPEAYEAFLQKQAEYNRKSMIRKVIGTNGKA